MKPTASSSDMEPLTEREQAVLREMARGLSDQDIADVLDLSVHTIKWYARRIYSKLHVKRRTQAVAMARSQGLLRDNISLPIPPTPLVGRTAEVNAILNLLRDESRRLVTIVGPGGVGKTRLALEIAHQWQEHDKGTGVYFVSLEDITRPDDMARVIADEIKLPFSGSQPLTQQVFDRLIWLSGLLILDNFEQLLQAVPFVSEVVGRSPDLIIVTTSRERLNIQAETVFKLDGLAYQLEDDTIGNFSSAQLFLDTAQRVRPDFAPNEDTLRHINAVCRLVEGMPLALKLAAGWVNVVPVDVIAAELKKSSHLLESSLRDLPERHQSMRAAFEGSWKLLSEHEQDAFKKLTVFQGGFDRAGAKAVVGATLSTLSNLIDKSLVMVTENNRYRIHPLLRQFGEEKLKTDSDDAYTHTLDAHCRYYGSLMEEYEYEIITYIEQISRIYQAIRTDLENVLAAWHYAIEQPRFGQMGQFVHSIAHHYGGNGLNEQGLQTMRQAVAQYIRYPDQGGIRDRLIALTAAGWFSAGLSEYHQGLHYLESAQELQSSIEEGNEAHVGLMKAYLAQVNLLVQDTRQARTYGLEALQFCRDTAFQFGQWVSLMVLGEVEAAEGYYDKALDYHQQAMHLSTKTNYVLGIIWSLASQSMDYCALGDMNQTLETFQKTLQMNRQMLLVDPVFMTLSTIAILEDRRGSQEEALRLAAILHHHPRCGGSARPRIEHVIEKLRRKVPVEKFNSIMDQAKQGLLSTRYVDSNFVLEPSLADHLLERLEKA